MTRNERSSMDWVFAVLASIVLHAAVVWLFFMSGSPSSPDDAAAGDGAASSPETERPAVADSEPPGEEDGMRRNRTVPQPGSETAFQAFETPSAASAQSSQTAADAESRRPEGEEDVPEFYVVRQGDTVTKIAKVFGTTPEELAKINGRTTRQMDKIWVGQKIRLRRAR